MSMHVHGTFRCSLYQVAAHGINVAANDILSLLMVSCHCSWCKCRCKWYYVDAHGVIVAETGMKSLLMV